MILCDWKIIMGDGNEYELPVLSLRFCRRGVAVQRPFCKTLFYVMKGTEMNR